MTHQIVALIVLLVLSGFFSSAETALFSISLSRARHLAKDKSAAHLLILKMKNDSHRLLTTILIGNNLVNIGASAIATALTIEVFPNYAVGIATGIMTLLILVFGEVFPKSYATRNNLLVGRLVIFPIYWLSVVFLPLTWLLNFIPRITGRIKKTPSLTEEELMTFVEVVEEEGEIKEAEKELIHNIFEFDDTNATEIMTPRGDMFVIDANDALDVEAVVRSGFTRIPVIDGEVDHIIGIVNVKDLFLHVVANGSDQIDVKRVMHPPYFVPENIKLDKVLQQFRLRKSHLAIIIDEYGGVSGLITLEDALEELVGEISDETDKEEPKIVQLASNKWMVPGMSDIDEVNEQLGCAIPDLNDYETFSGYVLHQIGRIPIEKEKLTIQQLQVTVVEKDGNRIKTYAVTKTAPAEANDLSLPPPEKEK